MSHLRTTIAGGATMLGGLITFVVMCVIAGGLPPANAWSILGMSLTTGAGLLVAADGKNVKKDGE